MAQAPRRETHRVAVLDGITSPGAAALQRAIRLPAGAGAAKTKVGVLVGLTPTQIGLPLADPPRSGRIRCR